MFTGIITEVGKVYEIKKIHNGAHLTILSKTVIKDASLGDSISVNGVCLTATEIDKAKELISFDVSYETLQKTTLGELKKGEYVNLEPALTFNTRLGGHLVSGHVEGIGVIKRIDNIGDYKKIEIEASKDILKYCIKKGSIAIDGISLTIVEIFPSSFTVVIIPHTVKMTTIGTKKIGDKLNLESDIIAKYVEKLLNKNTPSKEDKLINKLKDYGFIKEG
jgi:riboflavin synthase